MWVVLKDNIIVNQNVKTVYRGEKNPKQVKNTKTIRRKHN